MKYRKKPVIVDAIQWTGYNPTEIKMFIGNAGEVFIHDAAWVAGVAHPCVEITIYTLEGNMKASVGDYIIKGVCGELYPCKPEIFEQTYEPVEPEMNDNELNPCGFCGGKAYENMAGIFCEDCGMGVSRYKKTNKQVVEAWNNWDVEMY